MSSKFVDSTAIIQVIGCVYNNPTLLDFTDKYTITDEDFQEEFHKITFGVIYKLHELGAKAITLENIADFLASRPKSEAIFKQKIPISIFFLQNLLIFSKKCGKMFGHMRKCV